MSKAACVPDGSWVELAYCVQSGTAVILDEVEEIFSSEKVGLAVRGLRRSLHTLPRTWRSRPEDYLQGLADVQDQSFSRPRNR